MTRPRRPINLNIALRFHVYYFDLHVGLHDNSHVDPHAYLGFAWLFGSHIAFGFRDSNSNEHTARTKHRPLFDFQTMPEEQSARRRRRLVQRRPGGKMARRCAHARHLHWEPHFDSHFDMHPDLKACRCALKIEYRFALPLAFQIAYRSG